MINYKVHNYSLSGAVKDFGQLLAERPPFLFLDRDGTLVPIADNPKEAILSSSTSNVLRQLSSRLSKRIAIVSARSLNMLAAECDPREFILAGNYGLEMSFPSGQVCIHPEVQKVHSLLSEVRVELAQLADYDTRLFVDDHQYSFCLHFHKVATAERHIIHSQMHELEQKYPSLVFRALPTSYEILPSIKWNKASALQAILGKLSLSADDFLCMAFGDSLADEPMFQWVNRHHGLSFRVGECQSTEANSLLNAPSDVVDFLESLLLLPL